MPLGRTLPWLLRGLRTIVLLWVGLLSFALLLEVAGLRADPGPSDFKEMRQHLETRVNAVGADPRATQSVRFDNFSVSIYLVPFFLLRWMCGFGVSRRISPAAFLAPLLLLALIGLLGAKGLALIDRSQGMFEHLAYFATTGWVLGVIAGVTVIVGVALAIVRRVPQALTAGVLGIPVAIDRYMRPVFDLHSGRIATRLGRRMSFFSNAVLMAGLAVPSVVALWWACEWLDGRGGSVFAFVVRGALITICIAMVARAHMRSYGTGTAAQPG